MLMEILQEQGWMLILFVGDLLIKVMISVIILSCNLLMKLTAVFLLLLLKILRFREQFRDRFMYWS